MRVTNMILRARLRNGALINYDQSRIESALYRAARSIGGFHRGTLPKVSEVTFGKKTDHQIARDLANMVTLCMNTNPAHHVPNFPPDVEEVQDTLIHVLRSYGFIDVADVYEVYRWGKHWLREDVIDDSQFVGNGYSDERMKKSLDFNKANGCETILKLNKLIRKGKAVDLIHADCERYEKELDGAVKKFFKRQSKGHDIKIVIVAGPSSSGKTTTTLKIRERLMKRGLKVFMMNLDDYFWPVKEHPTDWTADRDYESPDALDYNLINQHIHQLLEGRAARMPRYNFHTGEREEGPAMKLPKGSILLLDCLHGLYPPLTAGIPAEAKFKVYLETQNMLYHGDGRSKELVRFTDIRMLRRMTRDVKHRNHPPIMTITHWAKVRASELANIIPLWGAVDHAVNGGLTFDLCGLKPDIDQIYPSEKQMSRVSQLLDAQTRYRRVKALLKSVESLKPVEIEQIPGDCVIREFIGGSTMKIPHNE